MSFLREHKNGFHVISAFILLGIGMISAEIWHLYYLFYWYDMMMHAIGGICLGLLGVYLVEHTWVMYSTKTLKQKIIFILCIGLVGGIFLEIYEFLIHILLQVVTQPSWTDTVSDIMFDMLGTGLIAMYYFIRKF